MDAIEKKYKDLIPTISMTADETERWALQIKGATDAMLKNVKALQDEAAQNKLIKEAETSIFKFNKAFEDLNDLFGDGAEMAEYFGFGLDKALKELEGANHIGPTKTARTRDGRKPRRVRSNSAKQRFE